MGQDSPVVVPTVGTRLQGLLLDEDLDDFNPRAEENNNGNFDNMPSVPPPCKFIDYYLKHYRVSSQVFFSITLNLKKNLLYCCKWIVMW